MDDTRTFKEQREQIANIDKQIGLKIRERRKELGISQQYLAQLTSCVTYQQIQKYEAGTNRVSAGLLFAIGKAMGVHPSYFFSSLDGYDEQIEQKEEVVQSIKALDINDEFIQITKRILNISDEELRECSTKIAKRINACSKAIIQELCELDKMKKN